MLLVYSFAWDLDLHTKAPGLLATLSPCTDFHAAPHPHPACRALQINSDCSGVTDFAKKQNSKESLFHAGEYFLIIL